MEMDETAGMMRRCDDRSAGCCVEMQRPQPPNNAHVFSQNCSVHEIGGMKAAMASY
jgi:hypothetical protein